MLGLLHLYHTVVPANMSTTIPLPMQDAVALYDLQQSVETFWFSFYDSQRGHRIGAVSTADQREFSYSGAKLLRDGYIRPYVNFTRSR